MLIAVLSFELMDDAYGVGGFWPTAGGFLGGAMAFSGANWALSARGAKHRKRCGECVQQPTEGETQGSGTAIAVGSLLDGIPESLVIGLSFIGGKGAGLVVLVGFFLA